LLEINYSGGEKINDCNIDGNVEFKNIKFRYPTRQKITILEDFNLSVKAGKQVALVGSSGIDV
jgi:ABC-type bacteriocin/lantibiotic exporter with double-glycine peptidase domain